MFRIGILLLIHAAAVDAAIDSNSLDSWDVLPVQEEDVSATPVYEETGELEGFQIEEIGPGSVYEHLGLKNGDVITERKGDTVHVLRDGAEIKLEPIR